MIKNISKNQSKNLSPLDWGEDAIDKQCEKARVILDYTNQTASSLLQAYVDIRKARNARAGTSTDQEQDLLRAMLVMAAAGLDGMAKQLIRDSVPSLIGKDQAVRNGLETFVTRQVKGAVDHLETTGGAKFIARLLSAKSHQHQAIEEYIRELTGGSLQSVDELIRIGTAFGLQPGDIRLNGARKGRVKDIFDIRNKIIHELDMNLQKSGPGKRRRNQRKEEDMMEYVNMLLSIGLALIKKVSTKLSNPAN